MFENIKLLLGLDEDTSKDSIIKYHIKAVTKRILAYCKLEILPSELEDIVEELVVKRMKEKEVKRVKMGDYEKEYVTVNAYEDELSPYTSVLSEYRNRKVRFV